MLNGSSKVFHKMWDSTIPQSSTGVLPCTQCGLSVCLMADLTKYIALTKRQMGRNEKLLMNKNNKKRPALLKYPTHGRNKVCHIIEFPPEDFPPETFLLDNSKLFILLQKDSC